MMMNIEDILEWSKQLCSLAVLTVFTQLHNYSIWYYNQLIAAISACETTRSTGWG